MLKNLFLVVFTLFSISISAQELPIDFSDNADIFTPFSGSSFATRGNPDDGGDTVGQFHNNKLEEDWQGFKIDLAKPLDLDENKVLKLNFYQFDPNAHSILIKLEDGGTNPIVEVSANIASGNGNSWSNAVSFDFANAKLTSNGTSINASGQYNRIVIFIDGGSDTSGTYLIDDIGDGEVSNTNPHELDVVYNDLVWSDDFDGNTIDANKWHHQYLVIQPGVGWANQEKQHYTTRAENSFVDNGNLNIVAKKEQYTSEGLTKDYTSARLNSKFAFSYGRVDVRAKLPLGQGTWPAIWMLGKNINERGGFWQPQFGSKGWPECGEIDIMEHGLHATNQINCALHTKDNNGGSALTTSKNLPNVAENFHIYSVNWSPDQITFLIDGEGYYTYKKPANSTVNNWPYYEDQYLLLNVAMGGIAGTIDPNFSESSMVIDYVKVYQNTTASTDDFFSSKFTVYPNPTSDSINIKTNEQIDKIELYSTVGQLVLKENSTNIINSKHISPGLYLMKIYVGKKVATKKIIIE